MALRGYVYFDVKLVHALFQKRRYKQYIPCTSFQLFYLVRVLLRSMEIIMFAVRDRFVSLLYAV